MSKRRLSDGRVVDLSPQEEAERAAEHAALMARAEETREALELREKIQEQLIVGEAVSPADRARYAQIRDKIPSRDIRGKP